jgi:hypothetical protein
MEREENTETHSPGGLREQKPLEPLMRRNLLVVIV